MKFEVSFEYGVIAVRSHKPMIAFSYRIKPGPRILWMTGESAYSLELPAKTPEVMTFVLGGPYYLGKYVWISFDPPQHKL